MIFDATSAVRARMLSYADAIGELHIISRGSRTGDEQDGKLFLHSVCPLPTVLGRVILLGTITRKARVLIDKHHIEVVSAQDPFEYGRAAMRAGHGTKAKLHIQVHTDFLSPFFAKESYKNSVRVRIADVVLPRANGIRTVSQRVKKSLIRRYGNRISNPIVIPIMPETTHTTAVPVPLPKLPFTFVIMAIARLEKEKRLDDAIRVVETLVKERYPVGLVIVGEGQERKQLTALAENLGIKERVVFLGEQQNVSALLPKAQAFIQTSSYEGYGRTYLEAALAGVPMVVTDAGIIGELFTHDDSALVCAVGDVTHLALEISRLIEDSALRHALSARALEIAQKDVASFVNLPARIADNLEKTFKLTNG